MQKRMIIFLHNTDPLVASWVVVDETNQIIQSVENSPLTAGIKETDVVVIVPAQEVLLTKTTLPKLNRQRLMQALPFALEEVLLDDIENLHFAIGDYQADDVVPVAVVSKQKMENWLNALKTIDVLPSALIPSTFVLPVEEKKWYVNCHNNSCVVRTGKYSGFASEAENLTTLLNLNRHTEKESVEIIQTELTDQRLLEKLSYENLFAPPINLLQGNYRAKRKSTHVKKIWMLAGILTAAWIFTAFFSNIVSFFILHQQTSHIETRIQQIYKRNFPQATSMVAPRQRMEEKLKKVFSETSKNNFLALLSIVGKSLSENSAVHLQTLEFREKLLTLEVSAASFDALDALTESLSQQGLNVKRQNAAATGAQVKASLIINAGES